MRAEKFADIRLTRMILGVTLVVGVMAGASAFAAPDWRGNGETTTFEQWSFSSWNYGPVNPDAGWDNDFGTPFLVVNGNSQWENGAWTLMSGGLEIYIPNFPVIQPVKEIWVELLWEGANFSYLPAQPRVSVTTDIGYDEIQIIREDTPAGDWTRTIFKINLWPNPPSEWLRIDGDIRVDKVVVDTYCQVPEPGTLAVLGLGAGLAAKLKRGAYKRKR